MDLGVPSDEEDRNGDIESEDEEEDGGSELAKDYDSVLDRRGGWDMGFTSWRRRTKTQRVIQRMNHVIPSSDEDCERCMT